MKPLIVVVEDEPELLALVLAILTEEHYDVRGFSRPAHLLAAGLGERPCLLLVDVMLPGMTGIELARLLQDNGFAEVPMVAMSASPDRLRDASRSLLFAATLPKPFDLDAMLGCVNEYAA